MTDKPTQEPVEPPFIGEIKESIINNNPNLTADLLDRLYDDMRVNNDLMLWVVDPKNLTELHNMLMEQYHILPKMLRIKNRVPERRRRALMFTQAMRVAVRRQCLT